MEKRSAMGVGLQLRVSLRTKLLLDLEGEARLARGDAREGSTPSRLVEKAVERAYGGRWGRRIRSSALRADEERRLRHHRGALGLTPRRLELLIHALRPEAFRIGALGRLVGLAGAEPASVALRSLHSRGLIRLRRLGAWHMSLWRAERGAELARWLQPALPARPRLRTGEERRLRAAGQALGLKPRSIELLVHSLKVESFRISELSGLPGLRGADARSRLRQLQARGLIRLRQLGEWRLSDWRAEKGSVLERTLTSGGRTQTGALRVDEEKQLRRSGQTLGLTPRQVEVLIHSLKRESFRVSELAGSSGMTLQGTRPALTVLRERGLIRLRRLGRSRWRAERGEFLMPRLR